MGRDSASRCWKPRAACADASPQDVAYLRDRVLMFRGEPQIYGAHYIVRDGVPELWTVRDPEGLDERRAAPTAQRCR